MAAVLPPILLRRGLYLAILWALVGLAVGPFLNLLIHRLPRLEKLMAPPACPECRIGRPFRLQFALLALLLGSRGRCGGCGLPPSRLAAAAELATAAAFWLLFLRFDASPQLLLYSFYACILIVIFFIDWQHHLILNKVTYPGIVVAAILTPLLSPVTPLATLLGLVVGGFIFGLLYAGGYLLYRQEVLGLGDVKLAILIGAMLGFPSVMPALFLGSFVGALASLAVLVTRRHSGRDFMPYGTSMCAGAFAAFFVSPLFFL
jgi:leader peptidase (prepilin peptidase) / N-methyltransferase